MKFCPVVPEICRGQVHGSRKKRRRIRIIIIKITRYDYNLTIMKSPKPATGTIYPHIKFWWYRTMLNFYPPFLCRVLAAILKMADISNWHYLPTYQILMISDNVEFLPPIFMPCFGSHFENGRHLEILKTQNCSSNGDLSLCQIWCLYHYPVRSYQH